MPMNNNHPRKSKEQRSWELRKMQMAGIKVDQNEIIDVNTSSVDLVYRRSLFLNHKYYESGIEDILNTKTEMYRIGNKDSKYYDNLKDVIEHLEGHSRTFNCPSEEYYKENIDIEYKDLPVYKHKDAFLKFYSMNTVMVVTGETGSGKSTLVPKLIYDNYLHKIAVTQPRRVSVKSLYSTMSKFYGAEVGYAIRFENCVDKDTKIKFMTEGILLKEIQQDPLLNKYDVVILDEAHERSVNLDILIGFLKKIRTKRPSLKIIIMSATINVSKFTSFFNCKSFTFDGKKFQVDVKYLDVDVDDYIEWTVKKTLTIIKTKEDSGNILVFLSGKDDIEKVFKLLCHSIGDIKDSLSVIKCYSEILNDVYPLIFTDKKDTRKIILSTNVAEASVTIPNVKYIVDSGFQKILLHDYSQGDILIRCPISKESANQRTGRCGRTCPGVCYRMYTEKTFNEDFDDFTVPEILRNNLGNVLLMIANMNVKDIYDIPLIDIPSRELVESCYDFLVLLGCLDNQRSLTQLGRSIIDYGVDYIFGKMIFEGIRMGCSYEMVLLVSILSCDSSKINSVLSQIRNDQSVSYKLICQNNDFITLLNIFKDGYFVNKSLKDQCNFIFKKLSDRIDHRLESNCSVPVLSKVLLKSFFFNLSRRNEKVYFNLISRSSFFIPKNTTVEEFEDYLTYFKRFKSKDRTFGFLCMKVDPHDVLRNLGDIFEDKKEIQYIKKKNIREITLDDTNLYDNFELDEEEEETRKVKRRRVVL